MITRSISGLWTSALCTLCAGGVLYLTVGSDTADALNGRRLPSVEINLDALERLRDSRRVTPSMMPPPGAPGMQDKSERTRPVANPLPPVPRELPPPHHAVAPPPPSEPLEWGPATAPSAPLAERRQPVAPPVERSTPPEQAPLPPPTPKAPPAALRAAIPVPEQPATTAPEQPPLPEAAPATAPIAQANPDWESTPTPQIKPETPSIEKEPQQAVAKEAEPEQAKPEAAEETPSPAPEIVTKKAAKPEPLPEVADTPDALPALPEMPEIAPVALPETPPAPATADTEDMPVPPVAAELEALPALPEIEPEIAETEPSLPPLPTEETAPEALPTLPDIAETPPVPTIAEAPPPAPVKEEEPSLVDRAVSSITGWFAEDEEEETESAPEPIVPDPAAPALPVPPSVETPSFTAPDTQVEPAMPVELPPLENLEELQKPETTSKAAPKVAEETSPPSDLPSLEALITDTGDDDAPAPKTVAADVSFLDKNNQEVSLDNLTLPDMDSSQIEEIGKKTVEREPDIRILFSETETSIPSAQENALKTLAEQMKQQPTARVTITAYAGIQGKQSSAARRVSLSRALAVRSYLIEQGVDNLRINVKAMGGNFASGPADRADLILEN